MSMQDTLEVPMVVGIMEWLGGLRIPCIQRHLRQPFENALRCRWEIGSRFATLHVLLVGGSVLGHLHCRAYGCGYHRLSEAKFTLSVAT